MRKIKVAALLLSGVIPTSVLAGCGSIDKNKTAAVFDGQEIGLGLPNLRLVCSRRRTMTFMRIILAEAEMYGRAI